ncbi:MAG TPA: hypothetical protein VGE09_06280 [Pseudoxanthomonas sp.]
MAIIDEIERFEAGADRIRAGAPSLAQRQDPVSSPAARPLAARPQPAGTRLGAGIRDAASTAGSLVRGYGNLQATNLRTAASVATAVPRAAGGFVRDAARAAGGLAPSPDAGRPLGLPQLTRRPAATAAAATTGALPENWSAGPRARPRPTAAAVAPAVPAAAPATATASNFSLQPGDVNTFTGADGVTKPVPGLIGASPAPTAAPVVAARPVAQQSPRGRQGAIIENPADSTADKLQRALTSSSLKGSPSARAAVAQAILGEAGARQDERASALATGDRIDVAAVDNAARVANGNAERDLAAQQTNAQLVEQRADRTQRAEEQRLARRPDVTVSADGSMGIVSNEGRFTPVTDANGRTVRAPQAPRQTGAATQGELLKSYTDRYNAIVGDVTTDAAAKQQAIASLDADPLYAGLRGGGTASATPAIDEFLTAARAANPGVSDEDLTAYYNQTYGGR